MPKSITRWEDAAYDPLNSPCSDALYPYIVAGQVNPVGEIIYGPTAEIPDGQYECHRTWTTIELAQNWIDTIDVNIANPLGFTSITKRVTP
jgi:hypothetical protein